jgi:hypothetical protein
MGGAAATVGNALSARSAGGILHIDIAVVERKVALRKTINVPADR